MNFQQVHTIYRYRKENNVKINNMEIEPNLLQPTKKYTRIK